MKRLFLFSLSCILLVFVACKKSKDKKVEINIEGFALKDAMGNSMGVVGNADDDWQIRNWSEFSITEQSFLNFSDNVDLTNTLVSTVYNPLAFPNPFNYVSSIQFRSDDSVKLKIAVVDSNGKIAKTLALKIKGSMAFNFDFSDMIQYPSGKSFRYYYSFSAAVQPNFKAGYGDVKVCRTIASYLNCF